MRSGGKRISQTLPAEGATGGGFQMSFEGQGPLPVLESEIGVDPPWHIFGRVTDRPCIVPLQPFSQITGRADIVTIRVALTSKDVDILYGQTPPGLRIA